MASTRCESTPERSANSSAETPCSLHRSLTLLGPDMGNVCGCECPWSIRSERIGFVVYTTNGIVFRFAYASSARGSRDRAIPKEKVTRNQLHRIATRNSKCHKKPFIRRERAPTPETNHIMFIRRVPQPGLMKYCLVRVLFCKCSLDSVTILHRRKRK